MKYREWLKSLKLGDEVWMHGGGLRDGEAICVVELVRDDDVVVDMQPFRLTSGVGTWGDGTRIHPVTDEVRARIWRRDTLNRLMRPCGPGGAFSGLSDDQLRRIIAIIDEPRDAQGGE